MTSINTTQASTNMKYLLRFLVLLVVCNNVVAAGRNGVRNSCQKIFETVFPPQEWTSTKDIKAFSKLVANTQDNYFACPEGGENEILQNYESGQLVDWFKANFNPSDFRYAEYIMGDIAVAGNVCSFDKGFFAEIGNSCQVQAMSRLIIEVDKHGRLVKWIDHFDEKEVNEKFQVCFNANDTPSVSTREESTIKEEDTTTGLVPKQVTNSVKDRCVKIFETLFPPQQWTSDESIEAFAALVTTDKPNYFACPEGGGSTLENFVQRDLLSWFKMHFDPDAFRYTEFIVGDLFAAGNTCSFDKLFVAAVGKRCQFQAKSRLLMELDDNGMLVKWMDHFDQEEVQKKFGTCLRDAAIQMKGAFLVSFVNETFEQGGAHLVHSPIFAAIVGVVLAVSWFFKKPMEEDASFVPRTSHSNYGSNDN